MIKEKLLKILTFNGVSFTVGILGSIASILGIFINEWDTLISLKWLVLFLFIALTILLIAAKLIFDLNAELRLKRPNKAKAVRYIEANTILLVEKSEFLVHSAMVTIFYLDDDYEVEFGKGYVINIQDKFIQIQITSFSELFDNSYRGILTKITDNDTRVLQKVIVKNLSTFTQ